MGLLRSGIIRRKAIGDWQWAIGDVVRISALQLL